jgi:hypothetical protein
MQEGEILDLKLVDRSVVTLGLQDVADRFQLYLETRHSTKLVSLLQDEASAVENIVLELHKASSPLRWWHLNI